MEWIFILLYLLIQVFIGHHVSKKIKDSNDYFLAGRSFGCFAVSLSLFATWFGAESCVGSAGAIYEVGLAGGRADPFGYTLNFVLLGLFVLVPFWKAGYSTLGDFFRHRYGSLIEKMVVWILLPSSMVWAGAQIKAFGEVLAATTPLNSSIGIGVATGFVMLYTYLGGMMGDIITDVLQGIVLMITLILVLVFVTYHQGGIAETISLIEIERISLMREGESLFRRFERWMIPIIGALFTQELIARALSAKSANTARRSSFMAGALYLSIGLIPAFLGVIGPNLLPGLTNPEEFLPLLAQNFLPSFLFILFSGALISAILSTVDSIILAQSALITQNLLVPYFKIQSEKKIVRLARIIVLVSSLIAFSIAQSADRIYDLVIYAESLGTAGVVTLGILGLMFKRGDQWAGAIVLTAGFLLMPIFEHTANVEAPFILSVLSCFMLYALVVLFRKIQPTLKKA